MSKAIRYRLGDLVYVRYCSYVGEVRKVKENGRKLLYTVSGPNILAEVAGDHLVLLRRTAKSRFSAVSQAQESDETEGAYTHGTPRPLEGSND